MTSLELLEAMDGIQSKHILAAQEFRSSSAQLHRRRWQLLLIAVALAALLAGCAVAYFTLRDARLGSYTRESSSSEVTETVDVLSLQGFVGSAGYQAAKEWFEYCQGLDPSAVSDSYSAPAEYAAYSCYTQEMADKIAELCQKYGLYPLGAEYADNGASFTFDSLGIDGIFASGWDAAPTYGSAYFYGDGTFHLDALLSLEQEWALSYRRVVKGAFDDVFTPVGSVDDYRQWIYSTAAGTPLLLAIGAEKALILADLEDSFITVSVYPADSSPMGMEQAELEALADGLDFSYRVDSVDIAAAQAGMQAQQEALESLQAPNLDYAAQVRELLTSARHADRMGYALRDLDGDGQAELLIGINGYFQYCYTVKDGAVEMLLSYAGFPFYCSADGALVAQEGNALHVSWVRGGEIAAERHLYYSSASGAYEEDMGTYRAPSSEETWDQLLAEHPRVWLKTQPLTSYPGVGEISEDAISDYGKGFVFDPSEGSYAQSYSEVLSMYSGIDSYALVDVDGDGQEELLTYSAGESSGEGPNFGLYGMSDGRPRYLAGAVVEDASKSILCQGGVVRTISRYPGGNLAYRFFRLQGDTLVPIDYLRYDADQNPAAPWLRSIDANGQDPTLEPISAQDAQDILSLYLPLSVQLSPAAEFSD